MEFDDAFAWLITWTTYGTWLPGDSRGHVSPVLKPNASYLKRNNTPGVEWAAGDERTEKAGPRRCNALRPCGWMAKRRQPQPKRSPTRRRPGSGWSCRAR